MFNTTASLGLRALCAAFLLPALACGTQSGAPADSSEAQGSSSTGAEESRGETTALDPSSGSSSSSTGSAGTDESSSGSDESSSSGALELEPAIGLIQYNGDAHFGDPEHNTAQLTEWAEAAIAQGATIVVFPEGSTYGYASDTEVWCLPGETTYGSFACRDVSAVAEPLPGGPTTDYWAAFASEHDVTVIYHVLEVDGPDYFNAVGIVDASGYIDRYRKRDLYYIDAAYATRGESTTVLETPAGNFGLMICIDGTYDGGYYDEYLALGVDRIINVMDWDDDPEGSAAAVSWFRQRADNNGVEIFAADVSTWDGTGHYRPGDVPRERNGLDAIAIGVDGFSLHVLEPSP